MRFDLDATGDNKLIMRDDGAGQGKLDYTFYLPVGLFTGSNSNTYVTLFSQFGPTPADDAGFAEWNILAAARISGIKFKDVNGDGVRDADGADNDIATLADNESPLAGFTMYIDINGNNKLDANEQTALTDANGAFEFGSLIPNASYVVREVLTAADVNGPDDAGTDVIFTDFDPPAGAWIQTTDPLNDGDQVVAVTTGTTSILVGNFLALPNMSITKSVVSVTNGDDNGTPGNLTDDRVDGADNVINYSIIVTNTGNVTLTGLLSDDEVEALGKLGLTAVLDDGGHNAGDTNDNFAFDPGEAWQFTTSYDVSQADIDNNGGGDGILSNIARARSDQTNYIQDDALVPIILDPDFTAVKSIVSVSGGVELLGGDPNTTADDAVDSAGDQINYALVIANTGNVTLDGETIIDTFEGAAGNLTSGQFTQTGGVGGALLTNGQLDVGETWTYNFTETVSQAELDALCADDELITNTLAASFVFDGVTIGPNGNTVTTPVVCNPDFTAVKSIVSVSGGVELLGGDPNTTADDAVDSAGDQINYALVIANTGNVTLDGETIIDTFEGAAGNLTSGQFTQTGGVGGALLTNGQLDVGETWTYNFTETVSQAELDALCADDELITNTLATSFVFGGVTIGPKGNTVNTPVVCNPDFTAVKSIVLGGRRG